MASGPITSWQIDGETMETVADFFSWAPKSLQTVTAAMKLRHLLLGRKVMTNLNSIFKSRDIPGGSDGKASACSVGDLGSIPGLGRSPGEGNGNPLQYSCLENFVE